MKLKSVILSFALLFVIQVGAQNTDTVLVDDFAEFNKEFLSELTPSLYEGKLINRASIEDITLLQLTGEDHKPHNWANWMFLYTDIYNAYVDTSDRLSVEEIYELLEKRHLITDILIQVKISDRCQKKSFTTRLHYYWKRYTS